MTKPNVLLVDPTFNPGNIPLNLGLGRIEAALDAYGIQPAVSDFVLSGSENISLGSFREKEADFISRTVEKAANADIVYVSGSHGMELKPYAMFPRIRAVCEAIKKANPNAPIVFGGALANYYTTVLHLSPAQFQRFGIDEFVTGQEVNAVKNILTRLGMESDAQASAFLNKGLLKPVWNAWDLKQYPDYLSLMIRTGCPYTCSFCFEGAVYDPRIPQSVPSDLPGIVNGIADRRAISSVMVEDSIAISLPWFGSLKSAMADTGLSWSIYARANEIVKNPEHLVGLNEAGCKSFIVGIESFEDELHQATQKKITTSQTLDALSMCADNDIAVQGCMILAFPDDTLGKIETRIRMAGDLGLSTYRWHVLQPNWGKLPDNIRGLEEASVTDILEVQVSLPDSCLLEYLEECPPMAMYDEHLLIRTLDNFRDVKRLENFGYNDRYNFRDFAEMASPLIKGLGLPLNEDVMYPVLFEPDSAKTVVSPASHPDLKLK